MTPKHSLLCARTPGRRHSPRGKWLHGVFKETGPLALGLLALKDTPNPHWLWRSRHAHPQGTMWTWDSEGTRDNNNGLKAP